MTRLASKPLTATTTARHGPPPSRKDAEQAGDDDHPLLEMQRLAGNAATVQAVTELAVQRDKAKPEPVTLTSPILSGSARLQLAANNQPSLTKKDNGEPVALMQQALVAAKLPMPKSTQPDGTMDGRWGPETYATVRKFQQIYGIAPLGGHEAGRKTLGMLDKVVKAPAPMTLAEFQKTMKDRWGVVTIKEGTFADQRAMAEKHATPAKDAWDGVKWQPFGLRDPDDVLTSVLQAFEDFASSLGGIPTVKEIVFFEAEYVIDGKGKARRQPDTGAAFGDGQLIVYRAAQRGNQMSTSRSVKGHRPSEGTVDRSTALVRNITHELGHGMTSHTGTGPAKALIDDWTRRFCWTTSSWVDGAGKRREFKLFDATAANRASIAAGTEPDASQHIRPDNYTDPKWVEQPITSYMVETPHEDFSEAVMTFINRPGALKSRSPQRHEFLDSEAKKMKAKDPKAAFAGLLKGPVAGTVAPPSVTPSSTPNAFGLIEASGLRIRKGPGIDHASIGLYNRGDQVAVLGQSLAGAPAFEGDITWYRTHRGWISGRYVKVTGNVPLESP